MPQYFYRVNSRGLTEAIETATGRVLCVQASHMDLLEEKWERLTLINTPEGPVWIEKGLDFDVVRGLRVMAFSRLLGDLLCQKVAEGLGLREAAKAVGVEYHDVCRWKREQKDFAAALEEARKDRAEGHFDEALSEARRSKKPYLVVETLKWATEKGDKARFGEQKSVDPGFAGVQTFNFTTNIIRHGDPGSELLAAKAAALPREVLEVGMTAAEVEEPVFEGKKDE